MPLYYHEHNKDYTLNVWLFEDLKSLIEENKLNIKIPQEMSIKRQTEFLATRLCLNYNKNVEEEVFYKKSGKPFLTSKKVSFSHTKNYVASITADFELGVDVEVIREKIVNIQHKFLHKKELWAIDSVLPLMVIWCAKEVLYKVYDFEGAIFSKAFEISKFVISDTPFVLNCRVNYKNQIFQHQLKCVIFDDFVLVFNLN